MTDRDEIEWLIARAKDGGYKAEVRRDAEGRISGIRWCGNGLGSYVDLDPLTFAEKARKMFGRMPGR